MRVRTRKEPWFIASLLLVALTGLLYHDIVRLWWTFDDLFHAHFVLRHSGFQFFFSPSTWRELPFKMFTPVQFLSYQADISAFGLQPDLFYAHQIVAFAAAVVAVFWVLRLWLGLAPAFLASLLFVLGAPTVVWLQELMLRHYIEGLLCSSLAVWFFTKSVRQHRLALSIASAVFYLAAMLAKEVYVPILGLLLLLPEGDLRHRARLARPHFALLAVYFGWRYAMLGTVMGGYGWAITPAELPRLALRLPGKLMTTFLGPSAVCNAVLIAALGAGIAVAIARNRRAALFFVVSLTLILLPVVPVAKSVDPRFGTLAWLAVVIAFASGCQQLLHGSRRMRIAACALASAVVLTSFSANRSVWHAHYSNADRMSAEGIAFLRMREGELLRHPRIPPAAMNELRWFKEDYLGHPKGAGWFADDLYLCPESRPIRRIWEYVDSTRSVADVTMVLPAVRSGYCAALRNAPLSAVFWQASGDFFWDLGPYVTGQYAIVFGDGAERFDVAPRDGYRYPAAAMTLRIRYESPEGWITFSPDLRLDFRRSPRIRWERRREEILRWGTSNSG